MTETYRWSNNFFACIMLLIVAFSVIGCGPPKYTDYKDFLKSPRPIVAGKPYVIEPPDSLVVIAPSAPEIHNVSLSVRSDGYVTLHLIGDIFAAGKTPTQLGAEIEEKILKYYQDVTVQVQLGRSNSKFYYMYGETSAGPKGFTGKDSVLHAVLSSGLPSTSWPSKAVLIRPNERSELVRRMSIDLKRMIETGDLKHNAVIEEGDILWVPINPFAMVGRVVQNLLSPVDPVLQAYTAPGNTSSRVDRAYDDNNNNNR
jgi:protein involved in polysaccharide export with SLBB domain